MKKKIIIIVLLLIVLAAGFVFSQTVLKPKHVHYHAGFQVYKDEKQVDFSDFKYMHELPCTINGKPLEGQVVDEQLEKAHLHDQTGDVVHVHREDALWRDLFTNIKFPVGDDAIVYIDGRKVSNFLDQQIIPYTSAVILIGKHADDKKYLEESVKKDYIQKVEKKSETCSS